MRKLPNRRRSRNATALIRDACSGVTPVGIAQAAQCTYLNCIVRAWCQAIDGGWGLGAAERRDLDPRGGLPIGANRRGTKDVKVGLGIRFDFHQKLAAVRTGVHLEDGWRPLQRLRCRAGCRDGLEPAGLEDSQILLAVRLDPVAQLTHHLHEDGALLVLLSSDFLAAVDR